MWWRPTVRALFGHSTFRFTFQLDTRNWIGHFNSISTESRNPRNQLSFLDFRLFSLLKAQKSNPGHKCQASWFTERQIPEQILAFGFQAASCGVPRLHPLVVRSPPFCACAVPPMTTLHDAARMEPVASVQLVCNQDVFVVPIGDLTVSMLVGKVKRGTIVVRFVGSTPQNYGSCVHGIRAWSDKPQRCRNI